MGMNDGAAIGLSAQVNNSANADAVYSLLSAIDRETINMRDTAGHWHRRIIDSTLSWYRRQAARLYAIFFVFWTVILLSVIIASAVQWFTHRQVLPITPESPSHVVSEPPKGPQPILPQALPDPPKPFDWTLVKIIVINVLLITGCIAFLLGYWWLFPRVSFVIGDGKERFDNFRWTRRFVVGSVIVCGILLPIARYGFDLNVAKSGDKAVDAK